MRNTVLRMVIFLFAPFFTGHLAAQTTSQCQQFVGQTEWTGTFTLTGTGSGTPDGGGSYSVNESIAATPDLTSKAFGTWIGTFNETIHINDTLIASDGFLVSHITDDEMLTKGVISALGQTLPALGINTAACTFEFDFDPTNNEVSTDGNGGFVVGGATGFIGGYLVGPFSVTPGSIAGPLPTSGLNISASVSFSAFSQVGPPVTWTMSLSLTPKQDLDLIVTIPDYSTWRPTANHTEKDIGLDPSGHKPNLLEIQALLVNKTTGQPVNFPPNNVTFSLPDVSSEPGVALNWPPLTAATNSSDMTFDLAQNPDCGTVSQSCMFLDGGATVQVSPTYIPMVLSVSVFLSPHDWGGWATLNVSANVGGQNVTGHLQLPPPLISDPNQTNILLPQRQPTSHIADSWKNAHGISLSIADNDDSESNPPGDGQPGDGFTLYEEYRGFYMGCSDNSSPPQPEGATGACQHVEGDPTTKDLFVVDKAGVPAGIRLFQGGSDLTVHFSGLKLAEVGPQGSSYRVINFNHGQGAHEVDQHAIVVDYGSNKGFSEAVTTDDYVCQDGSHVCAALPKHIDHIGLNANFKTLRAGAVNKVPGYRSDVAHELGHAVDVYHHGDADAGVVWWLPDPNTGGVIEESLDQNHAPIPSTARTVYIMEENQDPTALGEARSAAYLHLPIGGTDVYVGNTVCSGLVVEHGPHSGDVASFMRYHYASAYIPLGFPMVRFLVDELPGDDLTDHPGGTGVNAPGRQPRPRYGDADTTDLRGNDASQIDVNDNHNETVRPPQACP